MTTRVLAALALAAASKANVQTFEDVCVPTTEEEKAVLAKEVTSYMHNWRYKLKIREVQGLAKPDPRQPAILAYLVRHRLLRKGMNVLDLGSAAGSVLKMVRDELDKNGGHGVLTGVELCVEIKILRRVRAGSSRRPSRHRRDACSIAWWCSFLSARSSQEGRAIAEK